MRFFKRKNVAGKQRSPAGWLAHDNGVIVMTPKEFLEDHKHNFDCAMNDMSMREQWSAFGILWEKAQKQPWFNDFVDERLGYRPFVDYGMYHVFIESHNVKPKKFASALKEFLEKRSSESNDNGLVGQNRVKRTARGRRENRVERKKTGMAAGAHADGCDKVDSRMLI